uniref:Uncharacterized protein n=1 Tax=Cacopsylla melanoneura TaxID=428564 RepID=A0A8D8WS04_9HEMI
MTPHKAFKAGKDTSCLLTPRWQVRFPAVTKFSRKESFVPGTVSFPIFNFRDDKRTYIVIRVSTLQHGQHDCRIFIYLFSYPTRYSDNYSPIFIGCNYETF